MRSGAAAMLEREKKEKGAALVEQVEKEKEREEGSYSSSNHTEKKGFIYYDKAQSIYRKFYC
jgi:hypothetical protein